jgi:hypothetical protein
MSFHLPRIFRPAACLALLALAAPIFGAEAPFRAVRVSSPPRLDGLLDDEVWKQAVVFTGCLQAKPVPNCPPSQRTEVRILYDTHSLYLGIYCYDSEPRKIAANMMAHDVEDMEESDDSVKILLDPFQDKRTAYVFFVNPRGARSEGLAFGESPSLDWDGIWDAKARVRQDGWSAEVRIPFKTISFNPRLASWGINIERYIARRQETIRASGADLDSHFFNPSEAAPLEGIGNVKQGSGVTIRPYALGGATKDREAGVPTDWRADAGLDVYKNFTPNFVGAASVNTDFAETEVDERQINLTRFPLFFPEKRTFFLEGSEYFNFGTSSGGGQYHSSFLPFFSRRIGLVADQQVPVNFGAKLFGRLGRTNISVVDVGTRRFGDPAAGLNLPAKNLLAARVYQNLWEESRVGLIFTDGDPASSAPGGYNRLAGVDFRYATSRFQGDKNFTFDAWGVYNWWPDPGKKKHQGFGFRLDYPNDLWDINSSYGYFGDGLNPGLGFISRPGVQSWGIMAAFMPRPKKDGWVGRVVRQFFFEPYAEFYWDLSGRLETRTISFSPAVQLETGDRVEGDLSSNYDVLPFDFEVADGIVIPAGPYPYTNFRAGFESASHRPYQFEFNQHFGRFYSGRLTETELSVLLKYKGYATIGLQAAFIRGRLPQGNFNENIYEFKADFYFSPDLGLMNYVQYDDVSKELGWQARLRWRISPGNEVFFVYNKNWERRFDPKSRFAPLGDHGVLKIQLTIRP